MAEDPLPELLQAHADLENPIDISMYSEQELEDLWQEFLEHREASIAYAELPYYEIQAIDLGAVHGENPFSRDFPYELLATSAGGFGSRIRATFGGVKIYFAIVVSF